MNRLASTIAALGLLTTLTATDAAAQTSVEATTTARPSIQLGNVDAPEVEDALVSVEAMHDYKGRVVITLTVQNLAAGPDGPVLPFFEDERVHPGGRLAVAFGDVTFRGRIRTVRSEMHPNLVPRVVLEASSIDSVNCNQDEFEVEPDHFEGELRESKTGTPRRLVSGIVLGGAPIIAGLRLQFAGVGPWFPGSHVTEAAVHSWDAATGYRTSFTAEAETPTLTAPPAVPAKPTSGGGIDLRKPGACAALGRR